MAFLYAGYCIILVAGITQSMDKSSLQCQTADVAEVNELAHRGTDISVVYLLDLSTGIVKK